MAMIDNKIIKVWFDDKSIFVETGSVDILSHPLFWFPKLKNATKEELNSFEISPFGIHWEQLDEDLSLEGFYHYKPMVKNE